MDATHSRELSDQPRRSSRGHETTGHSSFIYKHRDRESNKERPRNAQVTERSQLSVDSESAFSKRLASVARRGQTRITLLYLGTPVGSPKICRSWIHSWVVSYASPV
jgi:hypothetical protein